MESTSFTVVWPVLHGSLASCISLESSLSPLDPISTVPDPLILQRPPPDAPDSAPCDITILFPKKHEIQQIYVRSTARIYEIYYAPDSKSANEYLCTVRCSPVQSDENESDSQVAGVASSRSSNTSASDDSWVDVTKSPDSNISKISATPSRLKEDLYEATAEISDAEPCISLTLRLLSIQSRDNVCVDEIYVYGDPVDEDNYDTEEQKNPMGNAAGSSLMALLAPTLMQLQLSKSGIGSITKKNSDSKELKGPSSHDSGSRGADLITATHKNLPELKPSLSIQQVTTYPAGSMTANAAEPERSNAPIRIPNEVVNHNVTSNDNPSRIEKALNELISRVIKIEDTCSRFEENMRKPICSIEERLSRVENQLSVLAKNSHNKFASGTRFSAPDLSSMESASSSSDVDESNPISWSGTENTLDIPSVPLHPELPGNGSSTFVKTVEVPPSFLSTEHQYSTHDVEDTDLQIPVHHTFLEQPKKTVSIDDALASALAAFMSSGHPQTLNKGFSIKAPEFSNSEESENNNEHSSVSQCAESTSSVIHEDETEVTHCKESLSSISKDFVDEVQDLFKNNASSMNGEASHAEEQDESCSFDIFEGGFHYGSDKEVHDGHIIVSDVSNDDSANAEYTSREGKHLNDSVYLTKEHELVDDQQKARNDEEVTNQEALLQVTELASKPLPVNFDTSILDVVFVSGEISSTRSSLEDLVTGTTADLEVEVPYDAEVGNNGDATTDDLISVEKETSILETTDSIVDLHHFDIDTTSLVIENKPMETESGKDLQSSLSHEVFPVSLI